MSTGADIRVGQGFDAHPFAEGRRLVLGGIEIPYPLGLAGHSDADVVIHAICDALLGAIGGGDIGRHFPNTDAVFKDISSLVLLKRVNEIVKEEGFKVVNIDATIIAEKPLLAAFMPEMERVICASLGIARGVNVKATTTEGMGFAGRGEGIAALAVALVRRA